jgi:hypothetical protein
VLDAETRRELSGSRRAEDEVLHDPEELEGLTKKFEGDRFDPRETELELPEFALEKFPGRKFDPRGQVIIKGGRPQKGGRRGKGSTVPDLYLPGSRGRRPVTIDAKNYYVGDKAGRDALIVDTVLQARQRAVAIRTARQHVVIDLRGQDVPDTVVDAIVKELVKASGGLLSRRRIHFLR